MKNKFYRPILYYLLVAARAFFYLLPYRVTFSFAGSVGKIAFNLLSKEKKKTLSHLRMAFGNEKTQKELEKIGQSVFENYGKTLCELAMLDKLIPRFDKLVTRSGYEYLDKALADGKGVIITVAHFGNWEIMGGYYAHRGYPVNAVGRKIYYEKYNNLLVETRKKLKMNFFYRDNSPKTILKILKKGEIICLVVDQDVETLEGVFVNFFGRPAHTPAAPVRFAMATGAPILPAFIIRNDIHHHIIVEAPIEITATGNKEEDLKTNTQKWVDVQERYIRQYPHLWVWNHKRWKTAPKTSI